MVSKPRFISVSRVFIAGAAIAALALGAGVGACSNQGEGERCDRNGDNGGNDECNTNLRCTPAGELYGSPSTDRCCPVNRTTASVLVCQIPPTPGGGDAAPPAIPADAAVPDVSVDAPALDTGTGDTGADAADAGASDAADATPGDAADASG